MKRSKRTVCIRLVLRLKGRIEGQALARRPGEKIQIMLSKAKIKFTSSGLRVVSETEGCQSFSTDPDWLPTSALPGTLEKIEVLRLRVSRRQPLWHPGDAER
jgi:hypothetical protein